MNKDEAERCKEIAKKAISKHDYHKAIRFLGKSNKLFHTAEADGLIKLWEMNLKNKPSSSSSQPSSSSGAYKRKTTRPTEDVKEKKYTTEELKIWNEIIKKSDYYDILGIEKKATMIEIKKKYRKLALKLHPDKNNAPKATDAFKKVSSAYRCLSDTQKRNIYDQHGTEENFQQNYREYFHEEEFDPFDLFDLLTGVNRHGRVRRPRRHYRPNPQQQNGNQNNLQQFLPLIFIVFLMVISNLGGNLSSGTDYSFVKTQIYNREMVTETHEISYFVNSDTFESLQQSRQETLNLEHTVEQDFYRIKNKEWRYNKDEQANWVRKARYFSQGSYKNNLYMEKANSIDLSSCEQIQEMKERVK